MTYARKACGRSFVLFVLLVTPGCSSSTKPVTDGSHGTEAGLDLGPGAEQGVLEGGTHDGGPPTDGPVVAAKWTIAAEVPFPGWETGALAAHPTQASTIAVKLEVSQFMPDVSVALSHDLGKTLDKVAIKVYPNPGPGHYDTFKGFAFDPTNGQKLALATMMPISGPGPGPGPDYDAVVFATSTNGGTSFAVSQLSTNPWPPDGIKLVAGPSSRLAVRAQHVLYVSEDLGQQLPVVFEDATQCLAHGDFAIGPTGDPLTFWLVCDATLLRCERAASASKPTCAAAQLPTGLAPSRVEAAPQDAAWVVVAGSTGIAVSTDGGKTFVPSSISKLVGLTKIAFDPRPKTQNVYILDRAGSKLYRSTDRGKSFQDISPPITLAPPISSYVRDFAIAADGAVIALGNPGVLRLAAP